MDFDPEDEPIISGLLFENDRIRIVHEMLGDKLEELLHTDLLPLVSLRHHGLWTTSLRGSPAQFLPRNGRAPSAFSDAGPSCYPRTFLRLPVASGLRRGSRRLSRCGRGCGSSLTFRGLFRLLARRGTTGFAILVPLRFLRLSHLPFFHLFADGRLIGTAFHQRPLEPVTAALEQTAHGVRGKSAVLQPVDQTRILHGDDRGSLQRLLAADHLKVVATARRPRIRGDYMIHRLLLLADATKS